MSLASSVSLVVIFQDVEDCADNRAPTVGSYMLNPTGANLGGKCGFVWGGTAAVCMVAAFFFLPEMKGYVT